MFIATSKAKNTLHQKKLPQLSRAKRVNKFMDRIRNKNFRKEKELIAMQKEEELAVKEILREIRKT